MELPGGLVDCRYFFSDSVISSLNAWVGGSSVVPNVRFFRLALYDEYPVEFCSKRDVRSKYRDSSIVGMEILNNSVIKLTARIENERDYDDPLLEDLIIPLSHIPFCNVIMKNFKDGVDISKIEAYASLGMKRIDPWMVDFVFNPKDYIVEVLWSEKFKERIGLN